MRSRKFSPVATVVAVALVALTGCGSDGDAEKEYVKKLTTAGFDSVRVSPETKTSLRKKRKRTKTIAYNFAWAANTDADPAVCQVTLRHPAHSSGSLRGDHWNIEEVNDEDVEGWGGESPDPESVRRLLREHRYDC
ncbi:hypothetical protein [Micromonospora sp. CPCC 205556]|uniref:hypothetical protein n=1 Tax=Micromonospora sp. CPCC 205556 TaxID=3122398 RepID=UPI002FF12540